MKHNDVLVYIYNLFVSVLSIIHLLVTVVRATVAVLVVIGSIVAIPIWHSPYRNVPSYIDLINYLEQYQ